MFNAEREDEFGTWEDGKLVKEKELTDEVKSRFKKVM